MSAPQAIAPSARRPERWIWAGLAALMLAITVATFWSWPDRGGAPAPPHLGTVPPFALTERSGATITRADLDGQPWVADFVFTRCTGMCPVLSARMADVRRAAQAAGLAARFVSFSVDPAHDRPAVLEAYAQRYGAGSDWLFLTGEREALYTLIGSGFRLAVAERSPDAAAADGGEIIAHSDRFVLVDGHGAIRGYYHGTDPDMMPLLLRDLAAAWMASRRAA